MELARELFHRSELKGERVKIGAVLGVSQVGEQVWEDVGVGPPHAGAVSQPDVELVSPSESSSKHVYTKTIKALHIFSGPRRAGDLHAQLYKWGDENKSNVWTEDFDLDISAKHNLLQDSLFKQLCVRIISGEFQILVAGPPCGTYSIARHSGPPGPPPVRSRDCLWGLPTLSVKNRSLVNQANMLVLRTIELCLLIHQANEFLLLNIQRTQVRRFHRFLPQTKSSH
jgi:hypothetical protein